jgi:hypothetical protein
MAQGSAVDVAYTFPAPSIGSEAVDEKLSLAMTCCTALSSIRKHKRRQNRIGGRKNQPRWMSSPAFRGLTAWAFDVCDHDKNGKVYKEDLYTGVLLVHLHLAKYFGIAAANPLNRTQVEDIFERIDVDERGWVDFTAFQDIVVLSTVNIGSRILVYYAMLMALAPFLTSRLVQMARFCGSLWCNSFHSMMDRHRAAAWVWAVTEWMVGHAVSVLTFAVVVPWISAHIELASVTKIAEKLPIRTRRKAETTRKHWWMFRS